MTFISTLKTQLAVLLAVFTLSLSAQDCIPSAEFACSRLQALDQTMGTHVGAPAGYEPFQERSATITVNYTGFSTEAQTAFQHAVDIWASLLESSVNISVDAYWEPLGDGVLGYASAQNFFSDFTNAPESDTYYPVALANKLAGFDLDPGVADIEAHFSSSFDWYFGTDGNPAWDEYDFVTVVLHELGHGFGVSGSGYVSGGIGEYGLDFFGTPAVYDLFVETGAGMNILNFSNNSTTLATQLESDNLYWSGSLATAANGGSEPAIFAPDPFEGGSSFSHFDEDAFPAGNASSLMTPYLGYQESIHTPGPVGIGMLNDMGWNISSSEGGCVPTSLLFEQFPCQDDGGGTGTVLPVINMTFGINGSCEVLDLCFQADGGGYTCLTLSDFGITAFNGDNINLTNTIADAFYEIYFTTADGTSSIYSWNNGNCDAAATGCTNPYADNYDASATTEDGSCLYSQTICDCVGNEHTLGVMVWNGDGFADDGSYDWDGVPVFFNCDMWGNDCGDTGVTGDPNNVCGGGFPANNGCAGGGCEAVLLTATQGICQEDPDSGDILPVINFAFSITGGCQVQDLCYQVDGAGYICTDMPANGFDLFDGEGINLINTTPNATYDIYFTTTDGDISPVTTFFNGNCDAADVGCTNPYADNYNAAATTDDGSCVYSETICDCQGNEHTIGVVVWNGDGFADDGSYDWDGVPVFFNCDMWGNDCGDTGVTGDPNGVCFGALPPNNGCESTGGCSISSIDVYVDGCGAGGTNDMQFLFDYTGDCIVAEICAAATFSAEEYCFDLSGNNLTSGDVWGITGQTIGLWEYWYTLDDGTVSPLGTVLISNCVSTDGCTNPYALNYDADADNDDGSCAYNETICDCQGNEHTIGVLIWNGDGFADDGSYDWDGVPVFFDCDMWGNDCGDTGVTGDPNGVCFGALPPNNGCESTGGCSISTINVYVDGCGDGGTNDMQYFFDFTGDCIVSEICTAATFSADEYCFDLSGNNLGAGDVWGITGQGIGTWEYWYTLDDGTVSPVGTVTITNCVATDGCTNPYALNYDAGADNDDGSCAYNETICDCQGNEHTIGVLIWNGDGFADDGSYDWDGVPVFFDCDLWGNDCGDTGVTGDPNGVCLGNLPPNNGCEPVGEPGCTDNGACNYDAVATVDDGSCEYTSCAGCMNANACNYDATATIDDASCEYDSCAGCTNANACNYDSTATIDDASCEFVSCAGCTNPNACNWDPAATLDDGSCEFVTCAGCTDFGACNWDPSASIDDGSCEYTSCAGCTEPGACNYDFTVTINDGSCEYITCAGCTDPAALNFDPTATIDDGSCFYVVMLGCIDPMACNYDATANTDDGSCEYITCAGCTDLFACNYDSDATFDDGSCEYLTCAGCTDPVACNYDATATLDDQSCEYETCAGCTDPTALNYDATATFDDGSCVYDCEYPTLIFSTFCEDEEADVFYILLDVDELGNGAPYLVSNNSNTEEYQVSFTGTVEIGPFANGTDVLVTVGSIAFGNCLLTSPLLSDDCSGDNVGELLAGQLGVYPNPTTGTITVDFPQSGTWTMGLYAADGRLVASLQTTAEKDAPMTWALPTDLARGIYTLRATQAGKVSTVRLIVQ